MISATDLKNGITFLHYGKPYQVIKYSLIKMGRGGAIVKVNSRNLLTGTIEEISYSSNNSVEEADTQKKKLQYLYKDANSAFFMDPITYEQFEIPLKIFGSQIVYIKEGESIDILYWEQKPLLFDLPPKVVFRVAQAEPGAKGNSASNVFKSVVLENGLTVKVPLFIKTGDRLKIDTRTGEYVERVKMVP